MNPRSQLPLELYKANLQLAVKINRLLKQCGERWLDVYPRVANGPDSPHPAYTPDSLPDVFLRLASREPGQFDTAMQAITAGQDAFRQGLEAAVRRWQSRTDAVLATLGATAVAGADAGSHRPAARS